MTAGSSGRQGESTVLGLLRYEGWGDIKRQVSVGGHVLDFSAKHVDIGEALHEVKVFETKSGRDTVKKALWDSVDLKLQGIQIPYILWLSHELLGTYGDQVFRAKSAGYLYDVRIIGYRSLGEVVE